MKPLPKPFLFLFNKYLTLRRASPLQALYLTNVYSKEEPRHLLIYHYITDDYACYYKHNIHLKHKDLKHRQLWVDSQVFATINLVYHWHIISTCIMYKPFVTTNNIHRFNKPTSNFRLFTYNYNTTGFGAFLDKII